MMIPMAKWRPFKVDESRKIDSIDDGTLPVGLKILTTRHHDSDFIKPIFQRNQIQSSDHACFLKSCFLCHKNLCPNKDVYMYRGDQGFCSEECRSRQIYIDDIRQLQISTKKIVEDFRRSRQGGRSRCDGRQLRHHHNDSLIFL